MMNVEPAPGTMFSDSLCRSPSQLRNRLDGLVHNEQTVGRARATSCANTILRQLKPDPSLSAESSRSGSLADLRKERLARAELQETTVLSSSAPTWSALSLPAAGEPVSQESLRRVRQFGNNDEFSRPRASSMPPTPRLAMFPISEAEGGC